MVQTISGLNGGAPAAEHFVQVVSLKGARYDLQ